MDRVLGREHELAVADRFLRAAGERFSVLRLEGEAGIGKTTVWAEVVARAERQGFFVLACRPAETEAKLALSAVADLLGGVPESAVARLPAPQRHAIDVVLLRVEPGATPLDRRTLAMAVRTLLAQLSAAGPLLIALDDVQWLDAGSATVLEFALRRLASERLGWLLTSLPVPARLTADGLVPPAALTRCAIGPLPPEALRHLLQQRLDGPLSRSALVRVRDASGGNPLYALEIARALDGALSLGAGGELPVPHGLRELVAGRVRGGPPAAREALLAAAALSRPTVALVERATSAAGLAEAEEVGLLRVDDSSVAFAHPLYASAVYGLASRARRRRLHHRLAQIVTDPEEQARHLALASVDADEDVAGRLEQGAALARARGAWESAAELLEHARRLTPPERRDGALARGIRAAEHHVHAGDRLRARGLLEGILAEPGPTSRGLRANALRVLAEISSNDDNFLEAGRLLDEARELVEDPQHAVTIDLDLTTVHANLGDPAGALAHAQSALERAEASGDAARVAEALALCAIMDFLGGHGVDWGRVERSLQLEDPDRMVRLEVRPSTVAGCLLLFAGRHAEARERLTAVWEAATARGDESDLAFVLFWLSWLETQTGDFAAAERLAEQGASLAALTRSRTMHAWLLAQLALVQAHRGEEPPARRHCAEARAQSERLGAALPPIWIAASLALLELSLGDTAAAWQACAPLVDALEQRGIHEPVYVFFVPDALEALIGQGELERAATLLEAFEQRARALDRAWALATAARCRGLLLAARGELAAAAAALEEALAQHERVEMPFELARTLVVRGVIERRARRRASARACLEQAQETFERLGARLWALRAQQELGRLGLRRAAGGELTATERRVAELAAEGLTNREVAAALFVSPKTVEANLARVYRKLGISSRAQLGARMTGAAEVGKHPM